MLDETRPSDRLDNLSPPDDFIGELNRLYHAIVELQGRTAPVATEQGDAVEMLRELRRDITAPWSHHIDAIIAAIEAERSKPSAIAETWQRNCLRAEQDLAAEKRAHNSALGKLEVERLDLSKAVTECDHLRAQLAEAETVALSAIEDGQRLLEQRDGARQLLVEAKEEQERLRRWNTDTNALLNRERWEHENAVEKLRAQSSDGLREAILAVRLAWNADQSDEFFANRKALFAVWNILAAHPASEPAEKEGACNRDECSQCQDPTGSPHKMPALDCEKRLAEAEKRYRFAEEQLADVAKEYRAELKRRQAAEADRDGLLAKNDNGRREYFALQARIDKAVAIANDELATGADHVLEAVRDTLTSTSTETEAGDASE
jgi:hypothetical protein